MENHKGVPAEETSNYLRQQFSRYKTSNLQGISPVDFERFLRSKIGVVSFAGEGYQEEELEQQRDLTLKYHWGHNHDFGTFKLAGRMGDRHFDLMTNFVNLFPIKIEDFKDKEVFDVGCWTGGTALLLAALGSKVLTIEEVHKYAQTTSFLAESFGISEQISIASHSLYDCNAHEYFDQFDIVYFPGVIYHLSDPVLALRILYNSLKVGGAILVESAGIKMEGSFGSFEGNRVYHNGTQENLSRGGWNWFCPSPDALHNMMREAGFENVQALWHEDSKRVYAYGEKLTQVGICKAGLSVPNIK